MDMPNLDPETYSLLAAKARRWEDKYYRSDLRRLRSVYNEPVPDSVESSYRYCCICSKITSLGDSFCSFCKEQSRRIDEILREYGYHEPFHNHPTN